jgi:hypothetical protein
MPNKTAWLDVRDALGNRTVTSVDLNQPYEMSGGATTGGSCAVTFGKTHAMVGGPTVGGSATTNTAALNKTAWLDVRDAAGNRTVISVDLLQLSSADYTMSGGTAASGSNLATKGKTFAQAGGVSVGGSATTTKRKDYELSSGVVVGGASDVSKRKDFTQAGGITTGGAASTSTESLNKTAWLDVRDAAGNRTVVSTSFYQQNITSYSMSGGIAAGGTSTTTKRKDYALSGGASLAGEAITNRRRDYVLSGGAQVSGTSSTQNITFNTYTHSMSGGAAGVGANLTGQNDLRVHTLSGGATTGGSALIARTRAKATSGGPVVSGAFVTARVSVNKTAWLDVRDAAGNRTVVSTSFYQGSLNTWVMTGGATLGGNPPHSRGKAHTMSGGAAVTGAFATSEQAYTPANKTAWLDVRDAAGNRTVTSVDLYQPYIAGHTMSGGAQTGGAFTTQSVLNTAQVTLTSVEPDPTKRLTTSPDLAVGDIIEWGGVVGGVLADVNVHADSTWSAEVGVESFLWRVNDGTGWSAWVTQYVVAATSHVMSGGLTTGGTAAIVRYKSHYMSGGPVVSGNIPRSKTRVVVQSGGALSGGTGRPAKGRVYALSGGMQTGGSPARNKGKAHAQTGGAVVGGAANFERGKDFWQSGGVVTGGTAAKSKRKDVVQVGGASTGGATTTVGAGASQQAHSMSGGAVTGGTAPRNKGKFYVIQGGASVGGTASTSRGKSYSAIAAAQMGGAALIAKGKAHRLSGGMVTGGVAVLSKLKVRQMVGGMVVGGAFVTLRPIEPTIVEFDNLFLMANF